MIAVIATTTSAWVLTGQSQARANIQDYLKGPNLFYPAMHDVNGTAINLNIDILGWNSTRIAGNLGIGNGSVRTFDSTSTFDVEYPINQFMAGEVSTQPWIPGLKTQPPPKEAEAAEAATGSTEGEPAAPGENVTAGNMSDSTNRFALQAIGENATAGAGNKTYNRTGEKAVNESREQATNATNMTAPVSKEQFAAIYENQTYAAYHPIQYLGPVKDILYEHPLSTSGTAYTQLLGFETPAGDLVNVAMKSTTFGY